MMTDSDDELLHTGKILICSYRAEAILAELYNVSIVFFFLQLILFLLDNTLAHTYLGILIILFVIAVLDYIARPITLGFPVAQEFAKQD